MQKIDQVKESESCQCGILIVSKFKKHCEQNSNIHMNKMSLHSLHLWQFVTMDNGKQKHKNIQESPWV